MEILIKNKNQTSVKITKEKTDPICLRASIGGTKSDGYYVVFRGDNMDDIESMLVETLKAYQLANQKWKQQNN